MVGTRLCKRVLLARHVPILPADSPGYIANGIIAIAMKASLMLILVALLGIACSPSKKETAEEPKGKLKVVSTIGMINDAVKVVGGDHVEAVGLMGPGIDPHLYRATASDVGKLESADIIFYGGLELEGRMTDIFVKMASRGTTTQAVTEHIKPALLREPPEFQGKHDPHIWFDVTLWKRAVETVRDTLSKKDPANRKAYEDNANAYLIELEALHIYVRMQANSISESSRILVTAHDAFGYFGQQYGFMVMGIQGTSTVAEASPQTMRTLADTIAKNKVKAIFVESSVPRATVEALQKAVESRGWKVQIGGQLYSDAMGQEGTAEGTYIGMVRHNIDTIVKALK